LYRLINYLFVFVVVYLFILEAGMQDHAMLIAGFILSGVVAYVAFLGNWITLDATKGVIILGTIALGFGGWALAAAIIFFFVTSSLFTRKKRVLGVFDDNKLNSHPHLQKRRDGYQIWANGFWLTCFLIGWFLFSIDGFLVAAFTALATSTSDTWATEIGTLNPGKTWEITTGNPVEPGADGGISVKGTLAALAGAAAIASFIFLSDFLVPSGMFFIVFLFGLAGCFADSILGAAIINKSITLPMPEDFSGNHSSFANSFVNWAATGISGILALIMTQLLF